MAIEINFSKRKGCVVQRAPLQVAVESLLTWWNIAGD
jgi:hypothetical protein